MRTLDRLLGRAEDLVGVLLLATILVVMAASVFFRYVLNDSLIWAEEVTRFGLILITFAGASIGFRNGSHIRIDVIELLPPPWPAFGRALVAAISAAVVGFLLVQAIAIMPILRTQQSAALEISMAWIYGAVAVALFFGLLRIAFGVMLGDGPRA